MGKPKKRNKKYQYDRNRRKEWKKSKKLPTIKCQQIKEAWDEKKSLGHNMKMMGLSADPNKTLPVPKAKDLLGSSNEEVLMPREQKTETTNVVKEMEAEASIPAPRRVKLSQPEVRYCIYMMEKYNEDYKAMARDKRNYYQETPKQIKRKIMTFKSIPEQYNKYLEEENKNSSDMEEDT